MNICRNHTRYEYIDETFSPRVGFLINGERFDIWDSFVDDLGLKIGNQRTYARAIGLFIDFLAAHESEYSQIALQYRKLFRDFLKKLLVGTIISGQCEHGLWWHARTAHNTAMINSKLNVFLSWIEKSTQIAFKTPSRQTTYSEQLRFWARWRKKKDSSLLGHLQVWKTKAILAQRTNSFEDERRPVMIEAAPKRFPDDRFRDLLNIGFMRRKSLYWTTVRDQMLILLLHGGGLRVSDALNIWINDVYADPEDPESVDVRLCDPHDGVIQITDPHSHRTKKITRTNYLRERYGRLPLSMYPGRSRVGSKGNLYQDAHHKFTLVYWRDPGYGRAFSQLYRIYTRIKPRSAGHPYMFITPAGQSMKLKGVEKVHAAAVRRIGLEPSELLGTTPHGHRHSYVACLRAAGLSAKEIQLAAHHKSITSQDVYGNLSMSEVRAAILKKTTPSENLLI